MVTDGLFLGRRLGRHLAHYLELAIVVSSQIKEIDGHAAQDANIVQDVLLARLLQRHLGHLHVVLEMLELHSRLGALPACRTRRRQTSPRT